MKKTITFLALFASLTIFSQAPQKMSYQAVVRNNSNVLIANTPVGMRISILQGSAAGTEVYAETQTPTTNVNGLVSLEIGGGTPVTGTFASINWGASTYFIKTETDPTGGTNYTITGTSQLLSVPYALYAQSSGNASNLQQVIDAGNSAAKTTTDALPNSVLLTTTGGNTTNANYSGIRSIIAGANGTVNGVYGISNGNNLQNNYGLRGFASNAGVLNAGVLASAVGVNDNYAVWGVGANAVNGKDNRGVMGYATTATATGWNYGVSAWTGRSEIANIAVGAYSDAGPSTNADNYGVMARATSVSTNGNNYGIFSEAANGAYNYAGFFMGDVTVTGTLSQPSDRKLKKDIHSITSALDKIKALEPVTYFYDTEKTSGLNLPKKLQYGFIAQDLEKVFPNLVSKQTVNLSTTGNGGKQKIELDSNGEIIKTGDSNVADNQNDDRKKEEFKGINYTGLISILTQGIKEQQSQIETLKAKNDALEQRMQNLEKLLLKK
jgi:endosialidase-like protein